MNRPLLPAFHYTSFSKYDFEEALAIAGFTEVIQVESRLNRKGLGVGLWECCYEARLSGIEGTVFISSSINPSTKESAPNCRGCIELTLASGDKKELRRIRGWRLNLVKAVQHFKTHSFQLSAAIPAES